MWPLPCCTMRVMRRQRALGLSVNHGVRGQEPPPPLPIPAASKLPAAPHHTLQAAGDAPAVLQGLPGAGAACHPGRQGSILRADLQLTASVFSALDQPSSSGYLVQPHGRRSSSASHSLGCWPSNQPYPQFSMQRFGRVGKRQAAKAAAAGEGQGDGGNAARKVRRRGLPLAPSLLHSCRLSAFRRLCVGVIFFWQLKRAQTSLVKVCFPASSFHPGPSLHVPQPGRGVHPRGRHRLPPGGRHLQPAGHPPAGHRCVAAHPVRRGSWDLRLGGARTWACRISALAVLQ